MNDILKTRAAGISAINSIALKGEIVIFGSTYMAGFPFYELVNKYRLEHAIYNRSIEGLTLEDAHELLDVCTVDLRPEKLFLALGDVEYSAPAVDSLKLYRRIFDTLRIKLPDTKLYVIGLPFDSAAEFNTALKKLCAELGIVYIALNTQQTTTSTGRYITQFKQLAYYFQNTPPSMADAFAISRL